MNDSSTKRTVFLLKETRLLSEAADSEENNEQKTLEYLVKLESSKVSKTTKVVSNGFEEADETAEY